METRQKQMSNFLQKEVKDRLAKKEEKLNQSQLPKQRGERSSGLLTSPDQRMVSDAFFCPNGAKAVRFICGGGAALAQGYTCKTKSQGTIKINIGTSGSAAPVTVEVPLMASNEWVEIFFQTTDPSGGYGRWELIF